MSQTIQVDIYQSLSDFMKMAPHFDGQTKQEIESFFAYCMEGMETDSQKLLATLLIKALNKKINSESIGENIYLGKYEISQIQLFNILIEKFPFVKFSQHITNSAIVEEMRGCTEVTLMDIGIGQGTQVINIIELSKSLPQLQKLHVVGIEPFGDALNMAQENILGYNGKVPFEISFTAINDSVENVDFATIENVGGKIIVNASLALHHIQSDLLRMDTIARVKAMNPSAFILIEPNVNHYEPDFHTRFENCYKHFYHIFQVIDRIENTGNNFALNGKRIVIAQPSYTLFDYHCKTYNIPYEPWMLTPELEYDYENIPTLGAGSVLIITTPNNPVGNTIEQEKLEHILRSNPESFVILDAVYAEFAEMDLAPLVRKYDNLMMLRSFSKAFPMAGLRFGYLCAAPQVATVIRKLMLQFSINHLTQVFAREVLFTPEFLEDSRQRVNDMIDERDRMFRLLNRRFDGSTLKVFRSSGNFLLVRVFDDAAFGKLLSDFEKNGIKVLNTSPFPLLRNTFRVSIGTPEENNVFLRCMTDSLGQQRKPQMQLVGGYYPVGRVSQFQRAASN